MATIATESRGSGTENSVYHQIKGGEVKQSERRAALGLVGHRPAWTTIRSWIRDMVKIEPKVMRQVVKTEFGDLQNWLEKGPGNIKACGCLVGTTALVMAEQRNHFKPDADVGVFRYTTDEFKTEDGYGICDNEKGDAANSTEVIAKLARKQLKRDMEDYASQAGGAAAVLGIHLGQDAAVALIKDEIQRALKRRTRAMQRRKLAHA
jgi:hypothetical protein